MIKETNRHTRRVVDSLEDRLLESIQGLERGDLVDVSLEDVCIVIELLRTIDLSGVLTLNCSNCRKPSFWSTPCGLCGTATN